MGIKRGYNALQKVGIQSFLLGLILLTSFFVSYDVAHAALCVGSDPDTNCTATYADLDAAVTAAGATETIYINTDGDTSTGADIDDQNISLAPYPGINDATTIEITGIIAVSESAGGPLTFNMDTLTYKANSAINLEDLVAPTTGSITADFTDVVFNVQGGGDCIITSKSANDAPPAAASININGGSDIQNCGFADQDLIVDGDATNGYGGNLTITNSTISSPIYIDINDQMDTFTFTGNTITGAAAVSNAQIDVFHNAAVVNTLDINFDNNTYQNGFGASYIMLFDPGAPSVDNLSITGNTITNGTVNGSYFLAARSGSPVTLDFNNNTTAVAGAADKANVTVSSSATTINTFNDNDLPHAYILGSLAGINDAGGIHDNVFAGMNFSNTTGSTLLIEANVFTDFQSSAHTGVPVVTLSGTPANPGLFTVQNNVIEIPYSGDMQGVGTLNDAAAAIDTTDTGTLDIHNNTIVSNSVKSAALILDGENATTTTYDNNVMAANYSDASPDAAIQCDATNGSSFSAERNVFYKHKYIDNGSDCGVGGEIDEDISAINDESNPTTPSTGQAPDDMFEVLAEGTISGYPRGAISDFAAAFVPNAFVGDYLKLFNDNGSDAYYLRILSNTDTIISVLHDEIEPQMLDNQVGLTNEYEVTDLTPSDTSILVDSGTGPGGSVPGVDKDDVVRPQGNAVDQGAYESSVTNGSTPSASGASYDENTNTVSWTFNDTDAGDTQLAFELGLTDTGSGTTYAVTPDGLVEAANLTPESNNKIFNTNASYALTDSNGASILTEDTTYNAQLFVFDNHDNRSASHAFSFTTPPTVLSFDSPTFTIVDDETLELDVTYPGAFDATTDLIFVFQTAATGGIGGPWTTCIDPNTSTLVACDEGNLAAAPKAKQATWGNQIDVTGLDNLLTNNPSYYVRVVGLDDGTTTNTYLQNSDLEITPNFIRFTDDVFDVDTTITSVTLGNTLYVQFGHNSLIGDGTSGGTQDATLTSPTTGDSETLTLTEDADTGMFNGSIDTEDNSTAAVGDGTLQAVDTEDIETSVNFVQAGSNVKQQYEIDDFQSYADTAAMNAVYTASAPPGPTVTPTLESDGSDQYGRVTLTDARDTTGFILTRALPSATDMCDFDFEFDAQIDDTANFDTGLNLGGVIYNNFNTYLTDGDGDTAHKEYGGASFTNGEFVTLSDAVSTYTDNGGFDCDDVASTAFLVVSNANGIQVDFNDYELSSDLLEDYQQYDGTPITDNWDPIPGGTTSLDDDGAGDQYHLAQLTAPGTFVGSALNVDDVHPDPGANTTVDFGDDSMRLEINVGDTSVFGSNVNTGIFPTAISNFNVMISDAAFPAGSAFTAELDDGDLTAGQFTETVLEKSDFTVDLTGNGGLDALWSNVTFVGLLMTGDGANSNTARLDDWGKFAAGTTFTGTDTAAASAPPAPPAGNGGGVSGGIVTITAEDDEEEPPAEEDADEEDEETTLPSAPEEEPPAEEGADIVVETIDEPEATDVPEEVTDEEDVEEAEEEFEESEEITPEPEEETSVGRPDLTDDEAEDVVNDTLGQESYLGESHPDGSPKTPRNTDTDMDGCVDFIEIREGTDFTEEDNHCNEKYFLALDPDQAEIFYGKDSLALNVPSYVVDPAFLIQGGANFAEGVPSSPSVSFKVRDEQGRIYNIGATDIQDNLLFSHINMTNLPDGDYTLIGVTRNKAGETVVSPTYLVRINRSGLLASLRVTNFSGILFDNAGGEVSNNRKNQYLGTPLPSKIYAVGKKVYVSGIARGEVRAVWNSLIFGSTVLADSSTGRFYVEPHNELEVGQVHTVVLAAQDTEDPTIRSKPVVIKFRIKRGLDLGVVLAIAGGVALVAGLGWYWQRRRKKLAEVSLPPQVSSLLSLFMAVFVFFGVFTVGLDIASASAQNISSNVLFEKNMGQIGDSSVKYFSRGSNGATYFKRGKVTYDINGRMIDVEFAGANPNANVYVTEGDHAKTNYFLGDDPNGHHANVPNFRRLMYPNVYEGIDLSYIGGGSTIKYEFVVEPRGDPDQIQFDINGDATLTVNDAGNLIINTPRGYLQDGNLEVFQVIDGETHTVDASFKIIDENSYGFNIGEYNSEYPLVIDPLLYGTYFGSAGDEVSTDIAVDGTGIYVAGTTDTPGSFPDGGSGTSLGTAGGDDVFVTKFASDGSSVSFTTFLGGGEDESNPQIAVDSSQNIYLTGTTTDDPDVGEDFPTAGTPYSGTHGGGTDAFVSVLNSAGNSLTYSSFLGGDDSEVVNDLDFDPDTDQVYIVGTSTLSGTGDYPTTVNAYDTNVDLTADGDDYGFMSIVDPAQNGSSSLVYSTYLESGSNDQVNGVAVDSSDNVHVVGSGGSDYPTTAGAFVEVGQKGFLSVISPQGNMGADLLYSTFLSSSGGDIMFAVDTDMSDRSIVGGRTNNSSYTTTPGAYDTTYDSGNETVLSIIDRTEPVAADQLEYSTFYGGNGADVLIDLMYEPNADDVYIGGTTTSTNLDTAKGDYTSLSGSRDAYIAKISPDLSGADDLEYSTYFGGGGNEALAQNLALFVDDENDIYFAGETRSSGDDLPLEDEFDATFNGGTNDVFLVRLHTVPILTVDSTGDGGDSAPGDGACDDGGGNCTLRAAIEEANALGDGVTIGFSIAGAGPHTISPTSALPDIAQTMYIDGTTEPDYVSTPVIELDGASAGAGIIGLRFGLAANTDGSSVKGLSITGFDNYGIRLQSMSDNTVIQANHIGVNPVGTTADGNGSHGIYISSDDNLIGGDEASERNIISGNVGQGVAIDGSGTTVSGNYIGTDVNGTANLGNVLTGVAAGPSTIIGGTTAGERNVISGNFVGILLSSISDNTQVLGNYIGTDANGTADLGNDSHGLHIYSSSHVIEGNVISGNNGSGMSFGGIAVSNSNTVQGNYIGVAANGTSALGNSDTGILFAGFTDNNIIGGTGASEGNIIANNSNGIASTGPGTGNTFSGNSIHSHNADEGIDIGLNGPDTNDADDPDTGFNNLQNYPVITSATRDGDDVDIEGTLDSEASTTFNIEFFATPTDDTSQRAGKTYLGTTQVTTDGSGDANFSVSYAHNQTASFKVSATATDDAGGSTSEFSAFSSDITVPGVTITESGDSTDVVEGFSSDTYTLVLTTQPTDDVTVNITPGADVTTDVPSVTFTDSDWDTTQTVTVTPADDGVDNGTRVETITHSITTVDAAYNGLAVDSVSVNITDDDGAVTFTVDNTGDASDDNAGNGICATAGGDCTLRAAIEEANASAGLNIIEFSVGSGAISITLGSDLDAISEALIIDGTSQPGYANSPIVELDGDNNATDGIEVLDAADGTIIQGLVINNMLTNGVLINSDADDIQVIGNYIGTNVAGDTDAANNNFGIYLQGDGATIGGDTTAERNVISGHNMAGIHVQGVGTTIQGNYIGTNADGDAAIGNDNYGIHVFGASGNTIGGTGAGEGNLISGNAAGTGVTTYGGITIETGNNVVQGNLIGTNADGDAAIGNGFAGIVLDGASADNNTIGGSTAAARNIISGNTNHGISIESGADSNTIQGNYIGTDINGASAIANSEYGIYIGGYRGFSSLDGSTLNTIGGSGAGEGNVISGNGIAGMRLITTTGIQTIQGNYIGTNAAGTAAVPNSNGIEFYISSGAMIIGGTGAGEGNVVSGNTGDGITFSNTINSNVYGNYIGTNSSDADLGNGDDGVYFGMNTVGFPITPPPSGDIAIGGTGAGQQNTIKFNDGDGIEVATGGGAGETDEILLSRNVISQNGELGIDLTSGDDGVTLNDDDDADSGPNLLTNFPAITGNTNTGTQITIDGILDALPNTTYTVDFFYDSTPADYAFGEGDNFIGTSSILTDGDGEATFSETFAVVVPQDAYLSAIAIDPDNNTSEFGSNPDSLYPTTVDLPTPTVDFVNNSSFTITNTNLTNGFTYSVIVQNTNSPDFGGTNDLDFYVDKDSFDGSTYTLAACSDNTVCEDAEANKFVDTDFPITISGLSDIFVDNPSYYVQFLGFTDTDVTNHATNASTVTTVIPDYVRFSDAAFDIDTTFSSVTFGDTLNVEARSIDLAGDGAGTLDVTITTTTGDSETLTLTENADTGVFRGSIVSTGTGLTTNDNASVEGQNGDTITLSVNELTSSLPELDNFESYANTAALTTTWDFPQDLPPIGVFGHTGTLNDEGGNQMLRDTISGAGGSNASMVSRDIAATDFGSSGLLMDVRVDDKSQFANNANFSVDTTVSGLNFALLDGDGCIVMGAVDSNDLTNGSFETIAIKQADFTVDPIGCAPVDFSDITTVGFVPAVDNTTNMAIDVDNVAYGSIVVLNNSASGTFTPPPASGDTGGGSGSFFVSPPSAGTEDGEQAEAPAEEEPAEGEEAPATGEAPGDEGEAPTEPPTEDEEPIEEGEESTEDEEKEQADEEEPFYPGDETPEIDLPEEESEDGDIVITDSELTGALGTPGRERITRTDRNTDNDFDGCVNRVEIEYGTNPNMYDSAYPGVSDCDFLFLYSLDPLSPREDLDKFFGSDFVTLGFNTDRNVFPNYRFLIPGAVNFADEHPEGAIVTLRLTSGDQVYDLGTTEVTANKLFIKVNDVEVPDGNYFAYATVANPDGETISSPTYPITIDASALIDLKLRNFSGINVENVEPEALTARIYVAPGGNIYAFGSAPVDSEVKSYWNSVLLTSVALSDSSTGSFFVQPRAKLDTAEIHTLMLVAKNLENPDEKSKALVLKFRIKRGLDLYIVGAVALVLIAGGGFWFYRRRIG